MLVKASYQLGSIGIAFLLLFQFSCYQDDKVSKKTDSFTRTVQEKVLNKHFPKTVEVTKGYDAIIHTAALHGKHTDLNYPRVQFVDTNFKGTTNLFKETMNKTQRR